jgi:hypothetical protein
MKLPEPIWRSRQADHAARMAPYCLDRTGRAGRGVRHPVRDFLFEYYSFTPARLARWSPGAGVVLLDARPADAPWPGRFVPTTDGIVLPAESFPRPGFLRWTIDYLRAIAGRPPQFSCFGLHEWAMVYRTEEIRHPNTPLRLSRSAIAAVVDAHDLKCTHFDAFRFFTPAARPRNRVPLTRADVATHDQPGCVHVTMDLYRYAFKLAPWIPAELLGDTFELAWSARELDMRASPYDLTAYGLAAIPIETRSGKDEYAAAQRDLQLRAEPLRAALLRVYQTLYAAVENRETALQ